MKTESSRHVTPEKVLDQVRQNFGVDRAVIYNDDQFRVGNEAERVVATPGSAGELAELLRLASSEAWRVIPAGSGTWLGVGNPGHGFDLIVSTLRLNQVLEYEPADLTATVGAGLALSSFNALAGTHGQWIPLDPFGAPESTIGATISTASYGPLRGGFGTPRDWLIGIQVAQIDGRLTRAGGKVVKNVAGYDLCKLYTGSYGTLAIITEMNFKLRSLAPTERTLVFYAAQAGELAALAGRLQQAALQPAAMELLTPSGSAGLPLDAAVSALAIRFMHEAEAVESQIAEAQRIGADCQSTVLSESDATAFWSRYHQSETDQRWTTTLRLSFLPANLAGVLASAITELPGAEVRAHAANGVLRILLPAAESENPENKDTIDRLYRLRKTLEGAGGRLVITRAAAGLHERIDVWGDPGGNGPLMLAIKNQYDPRRLLNPDRFVNGI